MLMVRKGSTKERREIITKKKYTQPRETKTQIEGNNTERMGRKIERLK
jgi:hypothetical protein